ncbi:AAA family ATPase [Fortiea sp. LEGE XX443]|uniref:AAA family ATPase n=1 Tax=Fortiea sp. LEGE XX443 TaxID=1828611 RepID=UPI0018822CC6|nr:AAA family ATPase [Fortiea sp. LEGE XX443]MBE9004722.1 AAA family ATPase [Fortiea sp. LEGE XX443]
MLTNIKIKNFRAFREDIDVRIRPITILIGRNSAGKSTLIKFLLMLQQTLESSESSEGDFFSTEGRHVSLGTFKDLQNTNSRSKVAQFTLNLKTNDLPDTKIQQIREKLQQSKAIPKIEDNSTDIAINLNPFSTFIDEDPLGQATSVKVDSQITANDLIADFCIFGSIPYSGKQAKHTVTCKIGGKKVLHKKETNIRRTRFLKFPLPNDPVEILKSAFDNLYLDGIRNEIISMRHLSPVREESERSVILGSPPLDDVGHRGEYAMPHLQRLLTDGGERADFVLRHIESVIDIEDVKFKSQVKGFIPEFRAKNKLTGAESYLADFGFGVSQCIPIFVQGALLNPGKLLIVEQPEAQIHPTAQLEMGSFFAELWTKRGVPSIIETHSENIIIRLRKLIATGQLKSEDVTVAYFYIKDNSVQVKNLYINSDGSFEKGLPMEFFGADILEALSIDIM